MTGAMYSAVAGLKTHMSAMNVIGHNIANVNTNAYKASSYTFKESLYTTSRSGSDGTMETGGVNPAQIGYGCSIGSIDMDMSTKNYAPTGRELDVTIDGDGFFMVGDKGMGPFTTEERVKGLYLERLGRLKFDSQGFLTDDQGQVVYGFLNANSPTEAGGAGGTEGSPIGTGGCSLQPYLTEVRLPNVDEDGNLYMPVVNANGTVADGAPSAEGGAGGAAPSYQRVLLDTISISKDGRITGIVKETDEVVVIGQIALGQVDNPEGLTHTDGRYFQALDGAGHVHVTSMGSLVKNTPTGDGQAAEGAAASETKIGDSGKTSFITGGLESSGTDLATEISNMILMQRGYQANTRIITVTDTMLEELVNMKR